jgi:hypothetical protein
MKQKLSSIVIFTWLAIVVGGCNHQQDSKESKMALIKTTQPAPVKLTSNSTRNTWSVSDKLRKDILHFDSIYDTAIIEGDKKAIVAYKVRHLHRFQMEKTEKQLTKHLDENYPGHTFIVSSDYKIFLEVVRLKEKMESGKISKKAAEKRFNQIITLQKETT